MAAATGLELALRPAKGAQLVDLSSVDADYTLSANIGVYPSAFTVGVAGDVKIDIVGAPSGWGTVVIKAIAGHRYSFVGISKIYRTGTTATGINAYL